MTAAKIPDRWPFDPDKARDAAAESAYPKHGPVGGHLHLSDPFADDRKGSE